MSEGTRGWLWCCTKQGSKHVAGVFVVLFALDKFRAGSDKQFSAMLLALVTVWRLNGPLQGTIVNLLWWYLWRLYARDQTSRRLREFFNSAPPAHLPVATPPPWTVHFFLRRSRFLTTNRRLQGLGDLLAPRLGFAPSFHHYEVSCAVTDGTMYSAGFAWGYEWGFVRKGDGFGYLRSCISAPASISAVNWHPVDRLRSKSEQQQYEYAYIGQVVLAGQQWPNFWKMGYPAGQTQNFGGNQMLAGTTLIKLDHYSIWLQNCYSVATAVVRQYVPGWNPGGVWNTDADAVLPPSVRGRWG